MIQRFIKKENNPALLLFFAGWGADDRLFNLPVEAGYDYLLCYDYRSLDFDYTLLQGYTSIRLLAWSMGVWVASQVFRGKDFPWQMKLAVNGTLLPVDDGQGIPETVFSATLARFSEQTLVRFRRRMCGSVEEVKAFLSHRPYRSVEELHEELAALGKAVACSGMPLFSWDKAVVGVRDKIFPAANQMNFWKGKTAVFPEDMEHYDDAFFASCISGEEEGLWTKD